jgi:hypothetical protein
VIKDNAVTSHLDEETMEWNLCYPCMWKKMTWKGRFLLILHYFGKHDWDNDGWCHICLNTQDE